MFNTKPLYCLFFSGTFFRFVPTMEQAEAEAEGQVCPQTGLSAMIDIFLPGDLQLVENIWWCGDEAIVHQDDVPWLS